MVRDLLGDRNRIEEIAARGHEHLLEYHTDVARATYILDIIGKKAKGR